LTAVYLRSSLRALSATAAASLALFCFAPDAAAAGEKDKDALKLHDQAMDDYLAVDFAKAEKKLKDALKKCGKDGCTPAVVGKLHVALGTVYGGNNKLDAAKDEFVAALKADSGASLNKDLTTPELEKAFKDAQKEAGASAKPAAGGEEEEGDEKPTKPSKKGGAPGGDLTHTPAAEQQVNTPVPVYIEIPEDVGATKATLRYKPFGASKWKSLEMHKISRGFGVEIPCEDVTTTGDIKYYVIAKDDAGEQVATAGSLKEPYKVPIKNDIEGEAPSLPGKKPPEQCRPKEDCPPGLPGCPGAKGEGGGATRGDKGWGASCDSTQECKEGFACVNGTCEEGKGGEGEGGGASKPSEGKRNLISLGVQLDMLVINSSDNVCSAVSSSSYACFDSTTGKQFYGYPVTRTGTNGIQGGLKPSSVRILAGYDRQLFKKLGLTAGLRLGIAFGGSPGSDAAPNAAQAQLGWVQANSFMPFHVEIPRISYVFGGAPHEAKKLRPYVFASFGAIGQINGSVQVQVCNAVDGNGVPYTSSTSSKGCPASSTVQTRGGKVVAQSKPQTLDAYQITGLNFVAVGGGIEYGITEHFGIAFEPAKFMIMFPTSGFAWTPSLSPVFAF
jgi:hypothetical protein